MTPEDRAWRISGGKVEVLTLPPHPDVYYVPENVKRLAIDTQVMAPVCLIPGRHDPDFETFSLPIVAEVASRLTPWAVWYWSHSSFAGAPWGGSAWGLADTAVCHSRYHPEYTVRLAYHEAWHLAEAQMRDDILDELDERLSTGPAWPGDYYPRAKERRARAFEFFCMVFTEGCRQVVVGPGVPFEIELFWSVYSGDFGREILDLRAKAARLSERPKSKVAKILEFIF